jgi:hypothetical protein
VSVKPHYYGTRSISKHAIQQMGFRPPRHNRSKRKEGLQRPCRDPHFQSFAARYQAKGSTIHRNVEATLRSHNSYYGCRPNLGFSPLRILPFQFHQHAPVSYSNPGETPFNRGPLMYFFSPASKEALRPGPEPTFF